MKGDNNFMGGGSYRLMLALGLALISTGLLLAACGGGDDATGEASPTEAVSASPDGGSVTPVESKPAVCSGASVMGLFSDIDLGQEGATYAPGGPVEITLVLTNCGDNLQTLHFQTEQQYRFRVEDEDGNVMWSSEDGQDYEAVEETIEIAINQALEFTETWDQTGRDGEQVPDGEYKVSAFSLGCANTDQRDCEFGPVQTIAIES